jgi:hypothetical protein
VMQESFRPKENEGAGNAGRSTRPQPRMQNKKHTSIVTTVTPDSSGIPRAMVLTVSSVISPVIGLCCHRRQRDTSRSLDASVEASGPHDFAVRIKRCSSAAHQRPSHPEPNVRDDRETPLLVGRDDSAIFLFLAKRQAKIRNFRIIFLAGMGGAHDESRKSANHPAHLLQEATFAVACKYTKLGHTTPGWRGSYGASMHQLSITRGAWAMVAACLDTGPHNGPRAPARRTARHASARRSAGVARAQHRRIRPATSLHPC